MLYHIMASADWEQASRNPHYIPESFARDRFIHCCKPEQLEYVLDRYFRGVSGLVVLCIDEDALESEIKYEDLNAEGKLFPHIYGPLNTAAVRKVLPLPPTAD